MPVALYLGAPVRVASADLIAPPVLLICSGWCQKRLLRRPSHPEVSERHGMSPTQVTVITLPPLARPPGDQEAHWFWLHIGGPRTNIEVPVQATEAGPPCVPQGSPPARLESVLEHIGTLVIRYWRQADRIRDAQAETLT
ncbi:hypothetical protein HWV62_34693 [Athelia sp. TMB]|nr:hypothetical protein HWV62_34693 [Athelia sp. TMB]